MTLVPIRTAESIWRSPGYRPMIWPPLTGPPITNELPPHPWSVPRPLVGIPPTHHVQRVTAVLRYVHATICAVLQYVLQYVLWYVLQYVLTCGECTQGGLQAAVASAIAATIAGAIASAIVGAVPRT